jgi:hypothetical protein
VQQVSIGTEKLRADATLQYERLAEKLSAQLQISENVERSQQALIERVDSLQRTPSEESSGSRPPSYTEVEDQGQVGMVSIRASCYKPTCRPWCSCKCHVRRSMRTPEAMTGFLGSLFVGYSGVPVLTQPCTERQCRRRSSLRVIASYQFPQWVWGRALFAAVASSRMTGPEMLIRVQNKIPFASETYQFCLNGNVTSLQRHFDHGLASPYDVDTDGLSLLHVSLSIYPEHK